MILPAENPETGPHPDQRAATGTPLRLARKSVSAFFPLFGCLCHAFKKHRPSALAGPIYRHDKFPIARAVKNALQCN
jgi:hypothetical protein